MASEEEGNESRTEPGKAKMSRITKTAQSSLIDVVASRLKIAQPVPEAPATPPGPKTYKISDERMPWLTKQVERLNKLIASINKRGAEFGADPMAPIQVKIVNNNLQIKSKTHEDIFHPGKEIQIIGQTPQIKGWQFVASLMPLVDENGMQSNVVKAVPGAGPVPEKYRTSVPKCDYCKQTRRRNETFILKNVQTGEFKEIGRNCLAKFLNTTSPEGIADLAESFAGLEEMAEGFEDEFLGGEGGGFGGGVRMVPIGSFMANTIAMIRVAGFLGRTKARENGQEGTATADLVWRYMDSKDRDNVVKYIEKNTGKKMEHRPEDVEQAKKIIQWARDLKLRAPESLNDYLGAIAAVGSSGFVPQKLIGYAASMPTAFQRQEATRGFFKGKVANKQTTETGSTAWTFKDDAGKDVVWFDAEHKAEVDAMLNKAMADKSDVYFNGTFEKSGSYSGQGMIQANVEKFMDQKQYEEENKAAIEKERQAAELLKEAPPVVPQGKMKMRLTVDSIKSFDSDFGTKVKYNLTDEFGRKFFWMTRSAQELEEGQTYESQVTVGWEKLPGQNKPLLDAEGKRSLSKDKYTGAIRLEKVQPISVGGKALVSGGDINALNKQIRQLREESDALEEQIRTLSSERHKLLSAAGADTSSNIDPFEEMAKVKQALTREIEKAKVAPQDQEYVASLDDAQYVGYKLSSLKFRDITAEEFLKEGSDVIARNEQALAAIKALAPQAEQLANEWASFKAAWNQTLGKGNAPEESAAREKASREATIRAKALFDMMKKVGRDYGRYGGIKNTGVNIDIPSFREDDYYYTGPEQMKIFVDFFKNPKADLLRLNSAMNYVRELKPGEKFDPSQVGYQDGIESKKPDPIVPSRFIAFAQETLQSVAQAEAQLPAIMQKLTPLQEKKKSLGEQIVDLSHKRDDMEESRRRGKPREAASWVNGNCKFASQTADWVRKNCKLGEQ